MGTLVTGPGYQGDTSDYDGTVLDAGDYDSPVQLEQDISESTAQEWAEGVTSPEHVVEATGGDLTDQERSALADVYGNGGDGGDGNAGGNSGGSGGQSPVAGGISRGSGGQSPVAGLSSALVGGALLVLAILYITQR